MGICSREKSLKKAHMVDVSENNVWNIIKNTSEYELTLWSRWFLLTRADGTVFRRKLLSESQAADEKPDQRSEVTGEAARAGK